MAYDYLWTANFGSALIPITFEVNDSKYADTNVQMVYGATLKLKVISIGTSAYTPHGLYLCSNEPSVSEMTGVISTITNEFLSVGSEYTCTLPDYTNTGEISTRLFFVTIGRFYTEYVTADSYFSVPKVISLDPKYRPKVEIKSVTPYLNDYNGMLIAGISSLQVYATFSQNVEGDTTEITTLAATCDGTAMTLDSKDDNNVKYYSSILSANSADHYASVSVTATDSRYRSGSDSSSILVKGYHLPRLSSKSYTSRSDQEGAPDGLGEYGHVYLEWDVESVDGTNTLQTLEVVLNEETILTATYGSIEEGYLEYIFPLDITAQGDLRIALSDKISFNQITGIAVPKGTMPLSLFDNGADIGVALGKMATSKGAWCYMPFYLLSSDTNSSKVFQIKVNDSGALSTELVENTNPTYSVTFGVGISNLYIFINGQSTTKLYTGNLYSKNGTSWDLLTTFSETKVVSLNENKDYKIIYESLVPSEYVDSYYITKDNTNVADVLTYSFTADYDSVFNVGANYSGLCTLTFKMSNITLAFDSSWNFLYPKLSLYYINDDGTKNYLTATMISDFGVYSSSNTVQITPGKYELEIGYYYLGIEKRDISFSGKYYKDDIQVSTSNSYTFTISGDCTIEFIKN